MKTRRFVLTGMAAVVLPASALAHHGWGSYDSTTTVTIDGVVEEVQPDNPHAELRLKIRAAGGKAGKLWRITLSPPFRMAARGKPIADVKVGDRVIAIGYQSKVNADEIRAERITHNGVTVELR